ncbi:L,D-transpeptidase family protein [Novosphingobium decolorationis]|uniref:L,D-transpeptidase family protein n=1 Tax=Novosphingobium decolorationis TaxID=2698673 RepID=A0ABX8E2X5_9SPHN|nr:L,D-transpeptidase family protein [Novosphingobium decolorationis]QVM83487.1 L,D-transpeptidase family protein [Novosphingobium decolorationis]
MSSRLLLLSGLGAIVVIGGVLTLVGRSDPAPEASPSPVEVAKVEPAPAPAPAEPPAPAPDEPFVIKRILPIEGPIRYGEWHWDEDGVPDGPLVITVDLDARVLSVFRGGYEIGATAVLLGSQEKPTPTGVFPITEKDIDHVSNIYTGAPMPYMQRLTNDGVSLHGSQVEKGFASHGCVGMPDPFAAKLFQMTKLGDKVYITRGKHVGMGDSLVEG